MGDNALSFVEMPGRVLLDVYGAMRRNHSNLNSYKLDYVSAVFLFGKVSELEECVLEGEGEGDDDGEEIEKCIMIHTDKTFGLQVNGYLHLMDGEGEYVGSKAKHHIIDINEDGVIIEFDQQAMEDASNIVKWSQAKDDVPPSEIFRLQKGNSADRATIARYCIQDCNLVLMLNTKVETIPNSIAMGNVCSVPLSYIFFRGQGIKLASLVFKECTNNGQVIRVLPQHSKANGELDGYEGAVVLEPKTGLYLDEPVAVLDYGSL